MACGESRYDVVWSVKESLKISISGGGGSSAGSSGDRSAVCGGLCARLRGGVRERLCGSELGGVRERVWGMGFGGVRERVGGTGFGGVRERGCEGGCVEVCERGWEGMGVVGGMGKLCPRWLIAGRRMLSTNDVVTHITPLSKYCAKTLKIKINKLNINELL